MRLARIIAASSLIGTLGLSGCIVGPGSIQAGRLPYAEAITTTGDEQLLQAIVRDRYDQRFTPLKVSSVTANVRLSANAGINAGFGPSENYDGNLVPLSAGVAYEENPIISYAPIESAAFLQQLLSPVPLDTALLVLRSSGNRNLVALMLFERINTLKNTNQADLTESADDFVRAVEILTDLFRYDVAEFVALGENQFGLLLQVDEIRASGIESELLEFMQLLELNDLLRETMFTGALPSGKIAGEDGSKDQGGSDDAATKESSDKKDDETGLAGADEGAVARSERDILVITIRFSAVSDGSSLAMTTRSVYDMLRIAAAGVDVPPEDIASGRTNEVTTRGPTGDLITIHRAESRPPDATVATRVGDWWYYIDAGDSSSRQYFRSLGILFSAQYSSADRGLGAPLLTVPVGR